MRLTTDHLDVPRSARIALAGDPESATSVWYLFHGYGQLAPAFLRSCSALAHPTRLLVAPEGLSRFYTEGMNDRPGASWMTREDREAEIQDQARYLDTVHAEILARLASPPARIVALGFSQGATTADRWVAGGSVDPDALVLWGGAPAMDLGAGTPVTRRVLMVYGDRDAYVTPKGAQRILDTLDARGQPVEIERFEGAHVIDPATLAVVADRLDPVDPDPGTRPRD